MRKFYLSVVDDDSGDQGYGRILSLLKSRDYISEIKPISNNSQSKGECLSESLIIKVFTSDYGDGLYESFCSALSRFNQEKDTFDFYIFDLKFDKNKFLPTHEANDCEQSKLYVEGLSAINIEVDKKSYQLAGLEFFNCVEINNRPKIILSAATQTITLRTTFKLIEKRLFDVFVIDNDPGIYLNDDNIQVNNAFEAIDTYLQTRQIAIINLQTIDKIQELNGIVKAWNGSIHKADEPLIPDSGTDINPENCWSLRTLFPKQVNRIESNKEVEENKKYILNVLNNFNFPDILFWLLFRHGKDKEVKDVNGNEKKINDWEAKDIEDRLKVLSQLDFPKISDKAINYKRFSEIEGVKTFPVIQNTSRDYQLTTLRQTIESQFSSSFSFKMTKSGGPMKTSSETITELTSDVVKYFAEFGIYVGDIVFIQAIAEANKHHCKATSINTIINYSEGIEMTIEYEFTGASEFKNIDGLVKTIDDYFDSQRYLGEFQLQQEGIEDLLEIICKRYKAEGKIQIGKQSVALNSNTSAITENESKVSYFFTFKSKNQRI